MVRGKKTVGKKTAYKKLRGGGWGRTLSSDGINIGAWEEDENIAMSKAMKVHGRGHWKAISSSIPTRTHSQVKSRGTYLLSMEKKGVDIFSELEDRPTTDAPSPPPSSPHTPFSTKSEDTLAVSSEDEDSGYKEDSVLTPVVHCEDEKETKTIFLGLTPTSNSKQLEQLRQSSSMSAVLYFIQTPESADKISPADRQVANGLILLQKGR